MPRGTKAAETRDRLLLVAAELMHGSGEATVFDALSAALYSYLISWLARSGAAREHRIPYVVAGFDTVETDAVRSTARQEGFPNNPARHSRDAGRSSNWWNHRAAKAASR